MTLDELCDELCDPDLTPETRIADILTDSLDAMHLCCECGLEIADLRHCETVADLLGMIA